MVKIMKGNKIVIVLNGKHAGRKAVVLKNHDDGTNERSYGHALVAGIERHPRPIRKEMKNKKRQRRSKIKTFIRVYNYNHLMPTRYSIDFPILEKGVSTKEIEKDATKKLVAKKEAKKKFQKYYKDGKYRWLFSKLRF